jgi:hypothetical protein
MHVVPYIPKIAAERKNELSVYPNPANDLLNISATEQLNRVEIFSMTGNKIISTQNNLQSIDISLLPYGMYQIVCIFNDGSGIIKSFIKS